MEEGREWRKEWNGGGKGMEEEGKANRGGEKGWLSGK